LGYPLPSCPRHFLAGLTVFSRRRPPIPCETGFILSYALRLFRVLPSVTCPGLASQRSLETRAQRARGAPSMGLPSLFATPASGIVVTRSQPRHLPSSAFRTPSAVSSATGLAGLFHPAATSRVPPFRDFSSQHSRIDSSPTRALSSVGLGRLRTVARSRQLPRPRPQGFVPCQESVAPTSVLSDAPPASLLGFCLLQVFPLQTVGDTFVPPSAHDLSKIS